MLKMFIRGLIVFVAVSLYFAFPDSAAAGRKYPDGKAGQLARARDQLQKAQRQRNRHQAANGRSKHFESRQEKNTKRTLRTIRRK